MGRPRKEIDYIQLEKLCSIQCTEVEIAQFFEVSVDTLCSRIKEEYTMTFSEYFKKHSADGKISLRRNQFKLSEKNTAMAIWLGKQYLGQKDPDKSLQPLDNVKDKLKEIANAIAKQDTIEKPTD